MVLVDTSVWVLFLRAGNAHLEGLLHEERVMCHPFIVGELACGNIKNRTEILSLLHTLPMAVLAEHDEVMGFIENHRLMGKGLGYVDAHLLASAMITNIPLWTLDKALHESSTQLSRAYHKN